MTKMKFNEKVIKIIFFLTALLTIDICYAQSFLDSYSELTTSNIERFFHDWKIYSKNCAKNITATDSVLNKIISQEYIREKNGFDYSEYNVLPLNIKVERYAGKVDTVRNGKWLEYEFKESIQEGYFSTDSIQPFLPDNGLYMTDIIEKRLSEFLGGIYVNKKKIPVNEEHAEIIANYIPVHYGHWGGYWWFYSFPLITGVRCMDNLIVVERRTSWHTGDTIWYIIKDGKFVRLPEPVSTWIE